METIKLFAFVVGCVGGWWLIQKYRDLDCKIVKIGCMGFFVLCVWGGRRCFEIEREDGKEMEIVMKAEAYVFCLMVAVVMGVMFQVDKKKLVIPLVGMAVIEFYFKIGSLALIKDLAPGYYMKLFIEYQFCLKEEIRMIPSGLLEIVSKASPNPRKNFVEFYCRWLVRDGTVQNKQNISSDEGKIDEIEEND